MNLLLCYDGPPDAKAAAEQAARERAEEGTGHARAAGLPASSRVAERKSTVWETILDQADQVNAEMIVVGAPRNPTLSRARF
jgi:nucleotide-binding universal stress UspA family protein